MAAYINAFPAILRLYFLYKFQCHNTTVASRIIYIYRHIYIYLTVTWSHTTKSQNENNIGAAGPVYWLYSIAWLSLGWVYLRKRKVANVLANWRHFTRALTRMTCTHFPTNANVFITVFTYSSTATMHEARPIITSDALATRILQDCNTSRSRQCSGEFSRSLPW